MAEGCIGLDTVMEVLQRTAIGLPVLAVFDWKMRLDRFSNNEVRERMSDCSG